MDFFAPSPRLKGWMIRIRVPKGDVTGSSLEIAHAQMPSILACEAVVLRYLLLVLHLTREIETPPLTPLLRQKSKRTSKTSAKPWGSAEPRTRTAFLLEGDTYTESKGIDAVNPQRKRSGEGGDERTRTIMPEICA
ncbi:hypothetical protein BHE74_00035936 [Ensete ventricosum]|nr:hypothetical protein BHE74_00035936 [Ensete ventricosum]